MRSSLTMKDVARAAGVSVMTVSRAFKADASVSAATRARILRLAEDLGYVFDATAANLRSQRTNFVAVVIPSLNNANFADTVLGLSETIEASGLQTLLGYTHYNMAKEEELIEQLLRRRPEAIIVTGGNHTERGRRLLLNAGVPVVETWDLPSHAIDNVVGFSNAACIDVLVSHLTATGRSRIAFIGGDTDGDTRGAERRRGFIAAMTKRGLDPGRLVGAGDPPISMREGAGAMARLLVELPDSEAVICVSDLSAFGALTECQRRGVSVPGDIAIAGFGAYDIAGICVPTLTTIDPQPRRIGAATGDLLLQRMRGNSVDGPIRIEVEPELKVGESTG